jgi:hypothetical protein
VTSPEVETELGGEPLARFALRTAWGRFLFFMLTLVLITHQLHELWSMNQPVGAVAAVLFVAGGVVLRLRGYRIWTPYFIPGGESEAVLYEELLVVPGRVFETTPLRLPRSTLEVRERSSSFVFRIDGKIVREIPKSSFASAEDRSRFSWLLKGGNGPSQDDPDRPPKGE